jgi:hypothetical protein
MSAQTYRELRQYQGKLWGSPKSTCTVEECPADIPIGRPAPVSPVSFPSIPSGRTSWFRTERLPVCPRPA